LRPICSALALSVATGSARIPARCIRRCPVLPVAAQFSVRHPLPFVLPLFKPVHSYNDIPWVEKHIKLSTVDIVYDSVRALFLVVLVFALISVLRMRSDHFLSKIILFAIFAVRMVPSILISMKFGTIADTEGPSIVQIVGDGLYLAILTSDLIIAKIASRQVHVLLPVIALASVISHHVSIVAAFIYHITILYDLCTYLQVRFGLCLHLHRNCTSFCVPNSISSAPAPFTCTSHLLRWCVRHATHRSHGPISQGT
jgi:hypothetical protein